MTKKGNIILLVFVCVFASVVSFMLIKQKKDSTFQGILENQVQKGDGETNQEVVSTQGTTTTVLAPTETIKEVAEISLTISSPTSGSKTSMPKATVNGKTAPKAEVFANEAEGVADANGNFSLSVILDDGDNSIIVTAVDESGKVAEKEIIVTYDAGE